MTTIMIVEDEKNIRMSVRMLLQRNGFHVIETDNGVDAVKLVQEKLPQLILLDILIPQMDGYLVCEAIRHNPLTKRIPVVFMSAKSQQEDQRRARELGGSDFITKPFTTTELLECIQKNLGGIEHEPTYSGGR
ncbi:response regulator [Anoxynatronum sibiricum]|uniref:Stage 0 sporulation protein A homolog n=1 Tax=Anoxynatronum sibiricum TaxID=210623 RepID=A0ABU9VU60_9CLOT